MEYLGNDLHAVSQWLIPYTITDWANRVTRPLLAWNDMISWTLVLRVISMVSPFPTANPEIRVKIQTAEPTLNTVIGNHAKYLTRSFRNMNSNIANSMSSRDKSFHDRPLLSSGPPQFLLVSHWLTSCMGDLFGWVQMRLVIQRNLKTIPIPVFV